jgi:hypothetical protein
MDFKDFKRAVGQTNATKLVLVNAVKLAEWTIGDEIQVLRGYSDIIKKDFDIRNSLRMGYGDTIQEKFEQMCVLNNHLLQQIIALRQDVQQLQQLQQQVRQDIQQLHKNVEDIGGDVNTLKASHPDSPFYNKPTEIMDSAPKKCTAQATDKAANSSFSSNCSFASRTAVSLINSPKRTRLSQPTIIQKESKNSLLQKPTSLSHDVIKEKKLFCELLYMMSENKYLKDPTKKLEGTWLSHLPSNEKQKYRDTMKLAQVVWDDKEEQLLRMGGDNCELQFLNIINSI